MKTLILLLALVLLIGCQRTPEVQIIPETAPDVNDETEQSRIEVLNQELADAKVECDGIEDELNATMCFSNKAAKSRSLMLTQNVSYPFDVVKSYCDASNNSDMCFFYVSVRTKNNKYCNLVEDVTGCNLASDAHFCDDFSNKNECLISRAVLLQFVDLSESARICKILPAEYHQEKEDDLTCRDIDFKPTEQEPYEDRFALTYVLSKFAEFEIEKISVRR